jgi:hypothetical protein
VATIGPDSHNASARPSLVPLSLDEAPDTIDKGKNSARPSKCWEIDSYLDAEILKQLRRELNEEIIDNEFNHKVRNRSSQLKNCFVLLLFSETQSTGGSYEDHPEGQNQL